MPSAGLGKMKMWWEFRVRKDKCLCRTWDTIQTLVLWLKVGPATPTMHPPDLHSLTPPPTGGGCENETFSLGCNFRRQSCVSSTERREMQRHVSASSFLSQVKWDGSETQEDAAWRDMRHPAPGDKGPLVTFIKSTSLSCFLLTHERESDSAAARPPPQPSVKLLLIGYWRAPEQDGDITSDQ